MDRILIDSSYSLFNCKGRSEKIRDLNRILKEKQNQIAGTLDTLVLEKRQLIEILAEAEEESKRSYHVSLGVKIGGSVVGAVGGIMVIVGFIPTFGAALPLVIAGSAVAAAGTVSGGAAAIGHGVKEKDIATRVNGLIKSGADIMDKLVSAVHEVLKSLVEEIHKLDDPQFSAGRQIQLIQLNLSVLLDACENPSEEGLRTVEKTRKLVDELVAADKRAREPEMKSRKMDNSHEIWISGPATQPVGNLNRPGTSSGPSLSPEQSTLISSMDSLFELFARLVKIQMFGTANTEHIDALKVLAGARSLICGVGIAKGALATARKAGVQTSGKIVGLVGSAVFTFVDIGLTVYYSWNLHQFKNNGRVPQLTRDLQLLRQTLSHQIEELGCLARLRC